jgi:large subunit ribosomal protein L2
MQSTQVTPCLWGDYTLGENQNLFDTYLQMIGNCISLANIPIGTWVHNIEWNQGQGAKLIQIVGTFVQIIKKIENTPQCIVWLPSSPDKLIDFQCRNIIRIVFNLRHGKHKLHKARQS